MSINLKKMYLLPIIRNLGSWGSRINELVPVDPHSVVHNFSSISSSNRLRTLLAFGLDLRLAIYKINYFQYYLKFESLFGRLKKLEHSAANIDELNNNLHFV